MTQPNAQPQPNYTYTPPSAQSTRHILESTSPNPSDPPNASSTSNENVPFRPQLITRKSSNYASADALARAAAAEAVQKSLSQEDGPNDGRIERENKEETGTGGAGVAWKPKFGRKQSWNRQDLKREMMMQGIIGKDGIEGQKEMGKGFSEGTGGTWGEPEGGQ